LSSPIGFWGQSKNLFVVVKEIYPFNKKKKMMKMKAFTQEDTALEMVNWTMMIKLFKNLQILK
jgi:hypothetical protein